MEAVTLLLRPASRATPSGEVNEIMTLNTDIDRAVTALTELPEAARNLLGPITSSEQLDFALAAEAQLSRLIGGNAQHPLAAVYTSLIHHITEYESEAFPIPTLGPGEILDFLMEQQGIQQKELADRLGVNQSTISRLIHGRVAYTTDLIKQLSGIFKVPPAVFLG